jgi:hypothetical protein
MPSGEGGCSPVASIECHDAVPAHGKIALEKIPCFERVQRAPEERGAEQREDVDYFQVWSDWDNGAWFV